MSATGHNTVGAQYRRLLAKHPFALFGLPFIVSVVAGSFFLTPATALRYEKNGRKVKRLSQDEAMGLGKNSRKVDLNEEYYVSLRRSIMCSSSCLYRGLQRLAMKDIDNWEQKRIGRLKGEADGIL